jgi:hypothetical protein
MNMSAEGSENWIFFFILSVQIYYSFIIIFVTLHRIMVSDVAYTPLKFTFLAAG